MMPLAGAGARDENSSDEGHDPIIIYVSNDMSLGIT